MNNCHEITFDYCHWHKLVNSDKLAKEPLIQAGF